MPYVSIYRDGIPALVKFRELKVNDEIISNNPELKFTVFYHDAELNGEEWFVHDQHHNPFFEADFSENDPAYKSKLPLDYYRAMVGMINHIIVTKDAASVLGALEACGVDEAMLKDLGYDFLVEICDECAAN